MLHEEPRPDPSIRVQLDRLEAQSEQAAQNGHGYQVVFTESARSSLELAMLRATDPQGYRGLVDQRCAEWEQSWEALMRFQPAALEVSVDPYNSFKTVSLGMKLKHSSQQLSTDTIGPQVPGIEIFVESPVVKNHFFSGFSITNSAQVVASDQQILNTLGEDAHIDHRKIAAQVERTGTPATIGRLLVIPNSMQVNSAEDIARLCTAFMADKFGPSASAGIAVTCHDERKAEAERLGKLSLPAWLADRVLHGLMYSVILFCEWQERRTARDKPATESNTRSIAELLSKQPIVSLSRSDAVQNATRHEIMHQHMPVSHTIVLDPESV